MEELLQEGSINVVQPQHMLGGHHSGYFLVEKEREGGQVVSYTGLGGLNPTLTQKQFRMITNGK